MSDFQLDDARPMKVSITHQTMNDIVSLLEVELREGEFESDYEYQKTQEILEECRKSLEELSSQGIVWHPYPETPLPETETAELYLVTAIAMWAKPHIRTAYAHKNFNSYRSEFEVIAWAKMPEPYQP